MLTDLLNGDLDFAVDSYKMMLVGVGYTANKDAHDRRNDVTSEITGSGYTTGGNVASCAITSDTNKKIITFSAVSWPSATFTAAGGVIYKSRGGASSVDELLMYLDFGGEVISNGGTFSVSSSVLSLTN